MRFVPHHALGELPNLIVDGAANEHSVLVLSHWPQSGTPQPLLRDTSAEIVLDWLLEKPAPPADAVSNDHFDEDGLLGIWAATQPEAALERAALVKDAARAGDFGTFTDRRAARFAFAVSKIVDRADASDPYPIKAAKLYEQLLPMVPSLLDEQAEHEALWREEDARLDAGLEALASGAVTIEELPELDLAIVRAPDADKAKVHRFTQPREASVHPMAIHNATRMSRIALLQGDEAEFQYRYESWVQYQTRRPLARRDLHALAKELGPGWVFDGVERITPRLHSTVHTVPPERFLDRLTRALRELPPAWDPFSPPGDHSG